jgi:ubiquinone/menaquinone biosynthesis C-methylase UbiE
MKFLIQEPGTIEFRLTNGSDLPFSNEELDAIYCISVLEHVPNIKQTIAEMFRILKPGGLLILTIDLDLRGDAEIGFENHRRLTEYLQQYFSYFYPETTIHPADMLNTISSPYAMKKPGLLEFLWFILKQHIAKPLVGKKPGYVPPSRLAVQGFVMTKKA